MARSVGAEAMVNAVEGSVKPRMNGKDSGALQVYHQKKFSTSFYSYLQYLILIIVLILLKILSFFNTLTHFLSFFLPCFILIPALLPSFPPSLHACFLFLSN